MTHGLSPMSATADPYATMFGAAETLIRGPVLLHLKISHSNANVPVAAPSHAAMFVALILWPIIYYPALSPYNSERYAA